ncbi:glycosyltransferase [Corynebacterium sp. YIM 101645]|uniref:Glycosyltransferase n=1 Tax=Corynebacterium lemuris TaxID=1859292 RepID=A0ABT2G033_9CORY|nr:glycosyltransferase [Corynebacterium lemuris]MCS5480350.1 glycosyltransferase [Corynebacterium lemuris]
MTGAGTSQVTHLIVGPDGHGVTEYALALARHTGGHVVRDIGPLPSGPVHVTFTDHLFGPGPAEAVERVLDRCAGHPLSVSLHDIPQPQEGAERFARRRPAYLHLAGEADLVVCNSRHESAFFDSQVEVIPLPVPAVDSPYDPGPGTVGILGFIYPGKGHDDLIRALAGTGLEIRALGGVSAGHEDWAAHLQDLAAECGVRLSITGYLSEEELAVEMGRIAVPVCAHRHYSASGSLMTWLGAGRHVLVSDSPYTREMAGRWPGRIGIVSDWREALLQAAASPTPPVGAATGWDWPEVAAEWRSRWAGLWPAVSVVIPYYNDAEGLRRVVAAVRTQDYPGEVEIIIADDGSSTPPPELGCVVVRQEDHGFRAAAARNLGAGAASGEVLAFLDGDTVPGPGYLRAVVPHVVADRRAVVVGSRLTGPEHSEPAWLRQAWSRTGHLHRADETSWRFIISAVLTCSRSFFGEFGGFDPTFVGYGGEDWEFGFRAWHTGACFVHEPRATATHDEPDWGHRGCDPVRQVEEKNAETTALAQRITHPSARPAGVIFPTADIAVAVPDFREPGVREIVIAGWLRAGDVAVVPTGPVPEIFRADPRVRTVTRGERIRFVLDRPVVPAGPVADLVDRICATGGDAELLMEGEVAATARTRRRAALGGRTVPLDVDWEVIEGPRRLERDFAGW